MMAERIENCKAELEINGALDEARALELIAALEAARDHIAQLEAQRGGSDLAELIRRRYPRMLERGNPLYDAVLADAVQRGGAVVVPELTAGDIEARLDSTFGTLKGEPENEQAVEWTFKDSRWAYNLAVSRIQPIPANQVLADGMVGVDREELMYLHAFEKYARKHGPESIQDVAGTLDHLRRAQQAKGE